MQDTPDLSKVINIIMQNPDIIAEISSLVKASEAPKDEVQKEGDIEQDTKEESEATTAAASTEPRMRAHRHELLNAMKPYLSENRRSAIDSMSSILDVIDVMIKR